MKERVLMLSSVASMIEQFNLNNIEILQKLDYDVEVACNFLQGNTCSDKKVQELKLLLESKDIKYYQIDFKRNIFNFSGNYKAFLQVKKILKENKYKFIHCHSPIGGVVGRIASYLTNTKVIYTAHGFHFFEGAPKLNWFIYYPIEKFLSRYTDILITINQEDYNRAKSKFYAKKVEYVPGIGIDIKKIKDIKVAREKKRKELGIEKSDIVLLSVGELNKNKNHKIIIEALGKLANKNIKYFIVGKGKRKEKLEKDIAFYKLEKNIKLLGYRDDVYELCKISDIFIFPSLREGLSVALMEAICCDLLVICSNIRGNNDLVVNGKNGYLIENNLKEYLRILNNLDKEMIPKKEIISFNDKIINKINIENINNKIENIYKNLL